MTPAPTRRPHAFTLVELLVVIGIIAVLISVLLPALGAARRQANAVRCASQLREIGNAINLYLAENKGWYPPVIHQANGTGNNFPTAQQISAGADGGLRTTVARNDYWYQFLLKYFTKQQFQNVGGARLADFERTPLWGCPEVSKDDLKTSLTSSADFDSGYGMGSYHAFRADQAVWATRNGGVWSAYFWQNISIPGRYYKQDDIKNATERGLVADSKSWFLEVRWFSSSNPNNIPQQRVGRIGADNQDENYFDRFRHGKYPSPAGVLYANTGGRVAFNVLFFDGHVETLNDIKRGYKVFRQRWPS